MKTYANIFALVKMFLHCIELIQKKLLGIIEFKIKMLWVYVLFIELYNSYLPKLIHWEKEQYVWSVNFFIWFRFDARLKPYRNYSTTSALFPQEYYLGNKNIIQYFVKNLWHLNKDCLPVWIWNFEPSLLLLKAELQYRLLRVSTLQL